MSSVKDDGHPVCVHQIGIQNRVITRRYMLKEHALQLPPLYPILDASFLPCKSERNFLKRLVSELAGSGVTLLQYRNKQGGEEEILADAAFMKQAADERLKLL